MVLPFMVESSESGFYYSLFALYHFSPHLNIDWMLFFIAFFSLSLSFEWFGIEITHEHLSDRVLSSAVRRIFTGRSKPSRVKPNDSFNCVLMKLDVVIIITSQNWSRTNTKNFSGFLHSLLSLSSCEFIFHSLNFFLFFLIILLLCTALFLGHRTSNQRKYNQTCA